MSQTSVFSDLVYKINYETLEIGSAASIRCQHLLFNFLGVIFFPADSARGPVQQIPSFFKVSVY